jgi:G patch domain-containing protein 1
VLPGFALLNEPVVEDKWSALGFSLTIILMCNFIWFDRFPLPDIPQGWTPNPQRVWSVDADKENVEQSKPPSQSGPLPHEKWRRSGITADQVKPFPDALSQ